MALLSLLGPAPPLPSLQGPSPCRRHRPALAPLARRPLRLAMPGAPLPGSSSLRFRIRGHFGPAFRPTVSSRGPDPNRAVSGPHSQRALSLSAPLRAARDSGPSLGPANPQPPVFSRSGWAPPLAPLRGHRLSKAEPPWGGHRPCPVTPRDLPSQVLSAGTGIAPSRDSVSLTGAEHLCSIPWVLSGAGRPRLNQEREGVKVS